MTANQLPKTGLIVQDFQDKRWEVPLNTGLQAWEGRVGVAGIGPPDGLAEGFFYGQTYFDTQAGILYYCTGIGNPGTWSQVATEGTWENWNSYVKLVSGSVVGPGYHQKYLGYEANTPGSWTMQPGGFQAGWDAKILCWNLSGGSVTIAAASGQSFVTSGQHLNSLTLNFPDKGELYSPDGFQFTWIGYRHFQSNQFNLNAGAIYNFQHSLGVMPHRAILQLVCLQPDLGYVPGDVVHISTDNEAANYGTTIKATPTTISAKMAVAGVQLVTWDTGITVPMTLQNWAGTVRAEVFN